MKAAVIQAEVVFSSMDFTALQISMIMSFSMRHNSCSKPELAWRGEPANRRALP
jgi:hypothetical protein